MKMSVLQAHVHDAELFVPGEHRMECAPNGRVHVKPTQPTQVVRHAQGDVLWVSLWDRGALCVRSAGTLAVRLAPRTRSMAAATLLVLVELRQLELDLNVAFARSPHTANLVSRRDFVN